MSESRERSWLTVAQYDQSRERMVLDLRGVRYSVDRVSPYIRDELQKRRRNGSHALKWLRSKGLEPERITDG